MAGETERHTERKEWKNCEFESFQFDFMFCKSRDSASTLTTVFFQNALPTKDIRMNGPAFMSALNRSTKVNYTTEKGGGGRGRWQLKK